MISGETLRTLRETKGWDQQTFAQHAGVDASVVSRLERGLQTDLKVSVLIRLAQALEVSLDALVANSTNPPPKLIGELEILLPPLQQISPANQRQIAAVIRSYLETIPESPTTG
jgi:transcriptional regulator with XRE-family HTH domain